MCVVKANGRAEALRELGDKIDSLGKIPLKLGAITAISLASFFTYYDVTNYAYISPVLKGAWHVTDADIAAGASLTVIGYVAGAIGIMLFADLQGRKSAFVVSVLVLGIGSLLAASAQNMNQLMMFRFITGVGIGSEMAISSVYIGELSPKSKRGKYTSFLMVLGWAGLTASGPVSLFLISAQFSGIEGWRMVLGIAGIVALISLSFRIQMPESPRWLLSKRKLAEANHALMSIGLSPLQSTSIDENKQRDLGFLKDKKVLRRIMFLSLVWFLVLVPIYASLLLVVAYVNQGYTLTQSITINLLSGTGFVAGGIMAIYISDRIERKYQIALAACGMSLGFLLRGILVHDFNGLVYAGFVAFFSNSWLITSLLAYTAENFPTEVRSSATGIVEGTSRGLGSVAPFMFVVLQPFGFLATMAGIATFSFASAGIIAACGIRTQNRSLEKINCE